MRHSCPEKKLKAQGGNKFIEYNAMSKEWLKSGALVIVDDQGWETNDGNLRGCTQTVTIAFDAKHKASVQRVTGKNQSSIETDRQSFANKSILFQSRGSL